MEVEIYFDEEFLTSRGANKSVNNGIVAVNGNRNTINPTKVQFHLKNFVESSFQLFWQLI